MKSTVKDVWTVRHAGKVDVFSIVRPLSTGGENHAGYFVAFGPETCRTLTPIKTETVTELVERETGSQLVRIPNDWFSQAQTSTHSTIAHVEQPSVTSAVEALETSLLAVSKEDEDLVRALVAQRQETRVWKYAFGGMVGLGIGHCLTHLFGWF